MINVNDLIGKPFSDGGRGPDSYDCFGLVKEVYRRYGIELEDYSISAYACEQISNEVEKAKHDPRWIKLDAPKVPCVVLLRADAYFTQHIGIYIGNGKFLHIRNFGVCIEKLSSPLWSGRANRLKGFYDYIEQ